MEDVIKLHDKKFRIMIPAAEIDRAVEAVARRINQDYAGKETPIFLGILNGSFVFAADLLRSLDFPARVSFVKMASYCGTASTGRVDELIGLSEELGGKTVVIVEDIIDTGLTMQRMLRCRNRQMYLMRIW